MIWAQIYDFKFKILQDFMEGKLPCLPGELPNLNDWENHLTTIFPEVCSIIDRYMMFLMVRQLLWGCSSVNVFVIFIVLFQVRLKRYLEMRGADGGPWRRLCALPAFWVGSVILFAHSISGLILLATIVQPNL